jgi:hypothetical protein
MQAEGWADTPYEVSLTESKMRIPSPVSAAIIVAFALVLVAIAWSDAPGGGRSEASPAGDLPIACENLIEATKLFAAGGTVDAPSVSAPEGLDGIHTRRYETLKRLLESCDAALATFDGG